MLKWFYFVLVAAFLGVLLWMLNDVRLRVNGLLDQVDRQLPAILDNTEQAAQRVNDQLPRIMRYSEKAARELDSHLPKLVKKAEQGVDRLDQLVKNLS
jgi:ABC-type transporter Mla subunit MlaD